MLDAMADWEGFCNPDADKGSPKGCIRIMFVFWLGRLDKCPTCDCESGMFESLPRLGPVANGGSIFDLLDALPINPD